MAKRGLRGAAFRLPAVALSVLLGLLFLEGLVRLAGLDSASYSSISGFCRHDPQLGWKLIPENRTVFKGRHFQALVETSPQGLRDRFYPPEPGPGRRRIVVLGDSVAWCWGVQIEECFTKRIETGLQDVDVITMGVPGYSTAQSMLFYERIGREFHPDRILFVKNGNDLIENLDRRKRPHFSIRQGELKLTNDPVGRRKSRLKEWLRNHSRLFVQADHASQVLQEGLRQWREASNGGPVPVKGRASVPPERVEEAWTIEEALLDRLLDRVRADGARLDIVTFQYPEWLNERTVGFCARRGCRVLEFDPIAEAAEAENREVLLRGDPHLSPEGNHLLADAVLEFLEPSALASPVGIR